MSNAHDSIYIDHRAVTQKLLLTKNLTENYSILQFIRPGLNDVFCFNVVQNYSIIAI